MKYALPTAAVIAASWSVVAGQDTGCYEDSLNNWYCSAVNAITYTNWGTPASFNKVTYMENGVCGQTPQSYSGGMSPFDDEVSWHFRGPLQLKQFASYSLGSTSTKRNLRPTTHQRRISKDIRGRHHKHGHLHKRQSLDSNDDVVPNAKREPQEYVTAVINGQTVSWPDEATPTTEAAVQMITATINGQVVSWANPNAAAATWAPATPEAATSAAATSIVESSSSTEDPDARVEPTSTESSVASSAASSVASSAASAASSSIVNAGAGNWGRQAYYNAEEGTADGLVFLNNHGGDGSGVFDYNWGMSLSYSSSDGSAGSASPVTLADTMIADNNEVIIMSDQQCNGDCGTVRPGTVAYHGFSGASKLFLLEFSMPLTGKTGFNMDMPAAWMLNAMIPRTLQYGAADCSCWESGCGEWDIFEILDSGDTKAKSTWHGVYSSGNSNYFNRPTNATQKAAVVFDGILGQGHIVLLDDSVTFDSVLSDSTVTNFLNSITDSSLKIEVALPS